MLAKIFKEEYPDVYDDLKRYERYLDELDFHARDVAERLRLPVAGWIHLEDTFNEGFYEDDGDENAAVRVAINKIMNQDRTIDFMNLRPEDSIPKQSVNHISEQFENTLEEDIETEIKYHYIDDRANKFISKRNELLKKSRDLHNRLVDIKDELRKEYNIQQEEIQQPMRAFI